MNWTWAESGCCTDWVTSVVCERTLRQVPPPSCKVRADTLPLPFFCSTTSRFPALSNLIDLGDDKPVAMSCALYPEAIDGCTAFAGVKVDEQLDDCAHVRRKKVAVASSVLTVAIIMIDRCEERRVGRRWVEEEDQNGKSPQRAPIAILP